MKSFFRTAFTALAIGAVSALPSLAQEGPATILVLDASGSMWGQIDGVNKITIARDVVSDILSDFPEDQKLGFVTYGHRERGQCSDIQTVIEPAAGTANEIVKIVNELNPRGMTPMTDAVIVAAQALRSTEQPATVILVSDGIETCNPDPCAAARELEKAGVDFTAHVIGFDVRGESEALMQMQCIAEETGGRFLTADNAAELSEALREVVAAPVTGTFTFTANLATTEIGPEPEWEWLSIAPDAPLVPGDILWEIDNRSNDRVATGNSNPFTTDLPFGEYTVTVHSSSHDIFSQNADVYAADSIRNIHVMFPPAEPPLAELTLRAVMDEENGPLVETPVTWTFTSDGGTFEFDGNPGAIELRAGYWSVTGYHAAIEQEKSVELALVEGMNRTYTMVFDTPKPTATLTAPASAAAGALIEIGWAGPEAEKDNIQIAHIGGSYINWVYTRSGNPVRLQMPAQAGEYELRYEFAGKEIIASTPITIIETEVGFVSPASAPAGSVVEIGWVGPNAEKDNVQIAPVGGQYYSWQYTKSGNPVRLQLPAQPGEYELRYEFAGNEVIATKPITVTPIDVSLVAPDSAPAGAEIEIGWTGPDAQKDNVQIAPVGGRYINWAYTKSGNPVRLKMPDEPGDYEVRYSFRDAEILVTRQITITAAE